MRTIKRNYPAMWRWPLALICALLLAGGARAYGRSPALTAEPSTTQQTELSGYYYVAPWGADSNPGTSEQPFATLRRAARVVNPGDTVIVRDGVYVGWEACSGTQAVVCLSRGGSSAAKVTLRAENPHGATLDGENQANEGFYALSGVSYVRLEGFVIRNIAAVASDGGASGIALYSGGDYFELAGLLIHSIGRICTDTTKGQNGLFIQRRGVRIEDVEVRDVGRYAPGEMGCQPSSTNYQNHDHGAYLNGSSSGSVPGASDVTLRRVSFSNVARGWPVQLYPGSVSGLRILDSRFEGPNPYRDGHVLVGANTSDCAFDGNRFEGPRGYALRFYRGKHTRTSVSNNVVIGAQLADDRPRGVTFANNTEL